MIWLFLDGSADAVLSCLISCLIILALGPLTCSVSGACFTWYGGIYQMTSFALGLGTGFAWPACFTEFSGKIGICITDASDFI